MSRRYQDDLRRIVGVDTAEGGALDPQAAKSPIQGGRGIVYFDEDGNAQTKSGVTPSDDGTGDTSGGTTIPSGGTGGGNTLPDEYAPTAVDAGEGVYDSLEAMGLGDTVKGVTLFDCATGDQVDVRLDGLYTAPDGCSNLPPSYTEGSYWESIIFSVTYRATDAEAMADLALAAYIAQFPQDTDFSIFSIDWPYNDDEDQSLIKIRRFRTVEQQYQISNVTSARYDCGASTEDYCTIPPEGTPTEPWDDPDTPPPGETEWPACKPTQLSLNPETSQYETHPLDTNVLPAYSQPVSTVDLCDGSGNSIKTYPTADGGQALYNATTDIAVFTDANGKVTGFGDGVAVQASKPK